MTRLLFRDDAYLRTADATVVRADERGVVLDRTLFYAQGGGQPGDCGTLRDGTGREWTVTDTIYDADRQTVLHKIEHPSGERLDADTPVTLALDWDRRFARMRIHTALHLLTTVVPFPVTGGSIGDGEGRLDFDMPDNADRAAIEADLNAVIAQDLPVSTRWITDEELLANPSLVKTMSVKPPMGTGRVRLVAIGEVDLQPCGGTHVARTGEIGRVVVTGIEKKGKQNRRVRIKLEQDQTVP